MDLQIFFWGTIILVFGGSFLFYALFGKRIESSKKRRVRKWLEIDD